MSTFTPLTLDGQAAADRLLSWGTYTQHRCLEAVHRAFPFDRSDAPGSYQVALDEWWRCPADRRHTDRTPPAGAICLWDLTVTELGRTGHIAISRGGGRVASTDWPERGRIGTATITEIERAWNATWLGWTDRIGGHTVITAAGTPAGKETTMWKNYTQFRDDITRALRFDVRSRGAGGGSENGSTIFDLLGRIDARVKTIHDEGVTRADVEEIVAEALPTGPLDYDQLARSILKVAAE